MFISTFATDTDVGCRALLSYIHKWRVNMAEKRLGRQTPTISVILPYTETLGGEATQMYDQNSFH